ncbi:unnamed protein product [Trichobilharzia regenti]|nr:unnamed protein product [Trichobilharzia regenti]
MLFYFDCERAERPSGVIFLESSYCQLNVNLKSSRDDKIGGQQGISNLYSYFQVSSHFPLIHCGGTKYSVPVDNMTSPSEDSTTDSKDYHSPRKSRGTYSFAEVVISSPHDCL